MLYLSLLCPFSLLSWVVYLIVHRSFRISLNTSLVAIVCYNAAVLEGFISPSNLIDSRGRYRILGQKPFSVGISYMSCHRFPAFMVCKEKCVHGLVGFPLYVTTCFPLVDCKIMSLALVFFILIIKCLVVCNFGSLQDSCIFMSFFKFIV